MTAKEIKNYIDMMKHTLNRRMDNQEGKDWLIDKYCNDMQKGMDAIEELEAIKSADGGEAMEELNMIREYYDEDGEDEQTCDSWKIIENYILKAQAQERELKELKEKVKPIIHLILDCPLDEQNIEELKAKTRHIAKEVKENEKKHN